MDEKKINIPANADNDLKLREGLGELYNPDRQPQEEPITEDSKKKREKLEYFTE